MEWLPLNFFFQRAEKWFLYFLSIFLPFFSRDVMVPPVSGWLTVKRDESGVGTKGMCFRPGRGLGKTAVKIPSPFPSLPSPPQSPRPSRVAPQETFCSSPNKQGRDIRGRGTGTTPHPTPDRPSIMNLFTYSGIIVETSTTDVFSPAAWRPVKTRGRVWLEEAGGVSSMCLLPAVGGRGGGAGSLVGKY